MGMRTLNQIRKAAMRGVGRRVGALRVRKPKYTSSAAPPHSPIGRLDFMKSGMRLKMIPIVTDTAVIAVNDSTCSATCVDLAKTSCM